MKKYVFAWLSCLLLSPAMAGIPIQFWVLDNGAKVYLMEVLNLPMVDFQLEFDAGSRRDGKDASGLAQATAMMMSKGIQALGSLPALDENQLGEAWADLGAIVIANATHDRMSLSLRSLTRPELLEAAIELASRQLAFPVFPAGIWQTERERWIASIQDSDTKPSVLAARAFAQAVYAGHPYGAEPTADSLRKIDTEMMAEFHARHFVPCRAKISIVGAIGREQANEMVEQLLASLPSGGSCELLPLVQEVKPLEQVSRVDIPFESAQAHIFIGQPGIPRQHPDYLPLIVGNYVLGGGGFVSRLTEQVREKRGLSYSVYSYFSPGQHAGAFTVGLQTRPDQAEQAIAVASRVVSEFVQNGPTEQEVQAAKNFLIGGFALRLDSNRKLMDNLSNIAWFDLPLDYLDHWTALVEKLTAADIQQAFARNLQPEHMVTVVLGPAP
ncbi:MAG: insulinase family protein [Limnohabitans sp.]|nr:insulinase family protein [Limnohabitans sp.]